jgi:hypothetical protein
MKVVGLRGETSYGEATITVVTLALPFALLSRLLLMCSIGRKTKIPTRNLSSIWGYCRF